MAGSAVAALDGAQISLLICVVQLLPGQPVVISSAPDGDVLAQYQQPGW